MNQIIELNEAAKVIAVPGELTFDVLQSAKQLGFSDQQIANLRGLTETEVRAARSKLNLHAVYKTVDTCAAEFEAYTPYFYSTYESECEAIITDRKKIIILVYLLYYLI